MAQHHWHTHGFFLITIGKYSGYGTAEVKGTPICKMGKQQGAEKGGGKSEGDG